MYQKPEVTRFGSFRELTLVGWSSTVSDGFTPTGPAQTVPVTDPVTNPAPRLS